MWFLKKKKKKEEAEENEDDDSQEEQSSDNNNNADNSDLANKLEMTQANITKINGVLDSFKETRKSNSERFSTINSQIGELRGMVNDTQRSVGTIEVKATKAADLVESVHPDKLMIQVQKEDGKIEGLRGILEAKEEMIKNLMSQVKKLRDQINIFRGVEQVIKLSEEVKDEIMTVKKISANVERHADRVDNVFIEAQKSFEAFNTFADKLDGLKADFKDLASKVDKVEVAAMARVKKKDFDKKIEKIERHDKKVKKILKKDKEFKDDLLKKFKKLEFKLRSEFEYKIEKADILSKAFDDLLKENPLFADGLRLQDYLNKHLGNEAQSAVKENDQNEQKAAQQAESSSDDEDKSDASDKKEGDDKTENGDDKKESDSGNDKKDESKEEKSDDKKDS